MQRRYAEVPWREMSDVRDKVSHEDFGVNLKRAFDTVREDLSLLRTAIARMLFDMEGSEQESRT